MINRRIINLSLLGRGGFPMSLKERLFDESKWNLILPFRLVYEGEGGEGGDGGDGGEGDGGEGDGGEGEKTGDKTTTDNNDKAKGKTFTQDDVNKLLAEDRKKNQQSRTKLIETLEKFKTTANLTEQEKENLAQRIEQLQNETLTAQELAKKDKDALVKGHAKELTKANQQTDFWKSLYSKEKIDREITDAAIEFEAASPQQIRRLLSGDTKLVETIDKDGKPTGVWTPKVNFAITSDEDGSSKILELNVKEAVKRMKEMPEHGNLFKTSATGGVGSYNVSGGSTFKGKTPPTDPVEYAKWRKENLRVGSKR